MTAKCCRTIVVTATTDRSSEATSHCRRRRRMCQPRSRINRSTGVGCTNGSKGLVDGYERGRPVEDALLRLVLCCSVVDKREREREREDRERERALSIDSARGCYLTRQSLSMDVTLVFPPHRQTCCMLCVQLSYVLVR